MKNKISIISTFYNAEQFLYQSINSVLKQSTLSINIEYVLVDDCSTDNSLETAKLICEKNINQNIYINIIYTPNNLGCGGARKFGIEHASGDYYIFLDADDYYINSDFVQRAYNDIINYSADIVEYGVLFNNQNMSPIQMTVPEIMIINGGDEGVYNIFKDNKIKFNVWSKIYTKEIVQSFPYSDTRTYEDIRTIPIWVSNAKRIVIMPTIEINYRASSNSIIREDGLKTRIGTITAMTEICEKFKHNKDIVKALYARAMIDLTAVLENHTSDDPGFNEMSALNTKLLSYIYPDKYKELTFNIEDNTNLEQSA